MLQIQYSPTQPICKVTFSLPVDNVGEHRDIRVLGEFNNWSWNDAPPMQREESNYFVTLELPNGTYREYQFRYCVDKQFWLNDPSTDGLVYNEFGTQNSLLVIDHQITDTDPAPAAAANPDNLRKIEGIGPKIEAFLNENGIRTYADIYERSLEELTAILEAAGPRFRLHKPSHWQEQARLAAASDWDGLEAYKKQLKAAKRRKR